MPSSRLTHRLHRLGTLLPLLGAGLCAWRPLAAQGPAATGQMAVRVTVLEPVQPMALNSPAQPPQLEHDPVTGRAILRVGLATDASVVTQVGDDASPVSAQSTRDSPTPGERDNRLIWRVPLPAEARWTGDTLEVRFTTRTGEAETIAIARVSREALRARLATVVPRGFRRGEPGLF